MNKTRKPSFLVAFLPILLLITLLGLNVTFFGDDTLSGSNQMALLFAAALGVILALRLGHTWSNLIDGVVESIQSAMPSILILLMIGSLAGTWLLSGTVPTMIYYGLKIIHPSIFLAAACIVSALVALATGSSWSTIATIGVALLGIGKALGMPEGLVAGAVISGSYFGDKMSPLSDTTNLAPAMAGTDLFTHIRYMMYTTIPSFTITVIIFLVIGFTQDVQGDAENIQSIFTALDATFNITPLLFLVPVCVIVLIVRRIPALPAILIGAVVGGVFALIFQPDLVKQIGEGTKASEFSGAAAMYAGVIKSMYGDISFTTSNESINDLLSTGGMAGMLNTVWLIVCAMVFGGVMEKAGFLKRIMELVIGLINSTGSLITSTVGTCVFFNVTASDQYLAIVVPGRMFRDEYRKRGLAPENLSRSLEDAGTVTSVLVPWNTCGATQSTVLGVPVIAYAPYCFFNIISPFMSIFFAYAGIKIKELTKREKAEAALEAKES
ncbi:MAG: Na+/H+ antiporter NhaC [Bacteroidota bacterium]